MKRASGVLMHVSTLPNNYSIGGFSKEAYRFIDALSSGGFSYWQTLPFCIPDSCNSPYKSFGAFSGNPLFIDLETLYEKGLITKDELDNSAQKTPYLCEFERLNKERYLLLEKASKRYLPTDEFYEFFKAHSKVDEFCKFMALKEQNDGKVWTEWTVFEADENALFTWRFIEYEFFSEWFKLKKYANEKGVSIIGDIPMYVDFDSADVFFNKHLFLLDENNQPKRVAGVPPDYFCEDGQLWGNPLYNYNEMKKDGFLWWRDRISFMCELFDGVRIDHFRAFESYYSIDKKAENAKCGKWVKGAGLPLINALKKASNGKLLIAEDLGIITEKVAKLVEKSKLFNMRVLQFAFQGENSPHLPHNYSNNCVAYTGTHDNNTLLGWVWEQSESERAKLLNYFGYNGDWNSSYDAILRQMIMSNAPLVVFPIQDLLLYGADTRLNTPGSSENNWAFRLTNEQLSSVDWNKFLNYNTIYGRK